MNIIARYTLLVLIFIVVSTVVHELVHLFQMGFKVDNVCFLGYGNKGSVWNSTAGWVTVADEEMLEKYTDNKARYEMQAEVISSVLSFILVFELGGRWKK